MKMQEAYEERKSVDRSYLNLKDISAGITNPNTNHKDSKFFDKSGFITDEDTSVRKSGHRQRAVELAPHTNVYQTVNQDVTRVLIKLKFYR